jgi:hypothetical protein
MLTVSPARFRNYEAERVARSLDSFETANDCARTVLAFNNPRLIEEEIERCRERHVVEGLKIKRFDRLFLPLADGGETHSTQISSPSITAARARYEIGIAIPSMEEDTKKA